MCGYCYQIVRAIFDISCSTKFFTSKYIGLLILFHNVFHIKIYGFKATCFTHVY